MKLALGRARYDPGDPMGKLFFNVLATFAEFETYLIRMRTREGMAIARARGKLRGKQPKLSDRQQRELCRMHATGEYSISDLAELFSVSRPTVYRTLKRRHSTYRTILPPTVIDPFLALATFLQCLKHRICSKHSFGSRGRNAGSVYCGGTRKRRFSRCRNCSSTLLASPMLLAPASCSSVTRSCSSANLAFKGALLCVLDTATDRIHIVVAGGAGGPHSVYLPDWSSRAVTRKIEGVSG